MNSQFEKVDVGCGLEGFELERYESAAVGNYLKIFMRSRDGKLLVISFYDVLHFIDNGFHQIKDFYKVTEETPLLTEALKLNYAGGKVPRRHPYEHFQFYDIYGHLGLEIICREITLESNMKDLNKCV